MEPKPIRIAMALDPRLLVRLDEWRFANRIASRMEAIRRLLGSALIAAATRDMHEREAARVKDAKPRDQAP